MVFFKWQGITSLSLLWGVFFQIAIFSGIFFGFLFFISRPLDGVTKQIRRLLGGQKYYRLRPSGVDEVAVITHFFNEITRNIESISADMHIQKKLSTELSVASQIQRDILPKFAPVLSGLDVVARTRSANELGGDSFDFIQIQNGTLMYVGDVSGHGVPAGLIMTMANTLMHVFSQFGHSPKEILVKTNEMLHGRISNERFMTMVMLRWDESEKRMFFTGAGHEHILIYRAQRREVEVIRTGGVALRIVPEIAHLIEEKPLSLSESDIVLLYTDGILEARNPGGEMYGLQRLVKSLEKSAHNAKNTDRIFEKMTEDFSSFVRDTEQADDITLLLVRRIPEGEIEKKKEAVMTNEVAFESKKNWSW